MAKKRVHVTWTESVIYSAEIEIEEGDEARWFEAFEANARPDWRQQIDEVEHRELLNMEPDDTCGQCGGQGTVLVPGPLWKGRVARGEIDIRQLKVKKGGLVREVCKACQEDQKCPE
jgi:hypothetical protein